jgi:hypothetical protein
MKCWVLQILLKDKVRKCRAQFFEEMRHQLYSDEEDRLFFADVQASIKSLNSQIEQGQVAIIHLEQHLLNVTCDDPGAALGLSVILPLLQDRLDMLAAEHAAREAERVQQELLQQSVRCLTLRLAACFREEPQGPVSEQSACHINPA